MASTPSPVADADDPPASSADSIQQPAMTTVDAISYPGLSTPMHVYSLPASMGPNPPMRTKRRQVKNACTNCQKACKKCDDARPCLRCVKYGIADDCVDSQRKERRKGLKRGPYKKRDGMGFCPVDQFGDPIQGQFMPGMTPGPGQPTMPFMAPMGYPPGMYPQLPGSLVKSGDPPAFYQPVFIPMAAPPPGQGQEGESVQYPQPPPQFYPATFLAPFAQPFPAYMMPAPGRSTDGSPLPVPYGSLPPMYAKPPSADESHHAEQDRVVGRRVFVHGKEEP